MKKLLLSLITVAIIPLANATDGEILKITEFTKEEKRQLKAELAESSGYIIVPTHKGPYRQVSDTPAAETLMKAKPGECYKVTNEVSDELPDVDFPVARKIKCPATPTKKATKKKMTQAQIDVCVDKWSAAYRAEAGEGAMVRHDMLSEWEAWCKQGKTP